KSAALQLLEKTAAPLASLRTTALGYLTRPIPRRAPPTPPPQRPTPQPSAYAPRPTAPPQRVITVPPPAELPQAPPAPAPVPLSKWSLDPRAYPWLSSFSRNLTALAAEEHLDPAIGREREIEELLDILGKRRANNPVLVGEPGVGKTAIVEGLAQRMLDLRDIDRILVELDVSGLVAGTQLRGSFSERLLGIKDEVKRADGRVVVFIDELHMLIGAGSAGGGPQAVAKALQAGPARRGGPDVDGASDD